MLTDFLKLLSRHHNSSPTQSEESEYKYHNLTPSNFMIAPAKVEFRVHVICQSLALNLEKRAIVSRLPCLLGNEVTRHQTWK